MMDNCTKHKSYYSQQLSDAFLCISGDGKMTAADNSHKKALCKTAISLSAASRSCQLFSLRHWLATFFSTDPVDKPVNSRYTTALSHRFFTAIDDLAIFYTINKIILYQ